MSDKQKSGEPLVLELAKGSVEEVKMKGHELCLKLTSALQGDKQIFLSFTNGEDFGKWMNKCKMASSLLDITNELFAVALDHCSYEIQCCGI